MPTARETNDDWARPGSWGGRKSTDAQDRRSSRGQLAPFGAPSLSQTSSRTLDALDLAKPHAGAKQAGFPSLDSKALAKAVGGDSKLAANIQARMQANQKQQQALMNSFMSQGFSAMGKMPAQKSSSGGPSKPGSRTLDALDLAKPRSGAKQAKFPSLDSKALAKAVGGDAKLAANIQARMKANQKQQHAMMSKVMGKDFSATMKMANSMHAGMHAQVMQGVNQKLRDYQPKKQTLLGALKDAVKGKK
ncbi:MAG TPA: hypothetical protein VM571_13015 [Noviherbaspirillum sp.]|nr:hypothetical protein [Noviherbaspirillum sp.]